MLECWTTLTAAAAHTSRLRVGSFINNVMNRHPAVLARMLATIWDQSGGRVDLGIGVGGSGPELGMYGIDMPEPPVRVRILEEAVAVIRLLWSGGPVDYSGEFFTLSEAWAHPAPEPPPRIIVGGEKPGGAKLAARVGDGWTTNAEDYERLLPIHLEELSTHGRSRAEVKHLLAVSLSRDEPLVVTAAHRRHGHLPRGVAGARRGRDRRVVGSTGRAAGAARGSRQGGHRRSATKSAVRYAAPS